MDPFIGQIMQVGFSYAPVNWLVCNGATLPIGQNQALFALIGTTFGGGGVSDFGLPDARGRALIGTGAGAGLTPRLPGNKGGVEQVTLTSAQLPAHSHNASFQQTGGGTLTGTLTAIAGLDFNNESAAPEAGAFLGSASEADTTPTLYVPANKAGTPGAQAVALAGVNGQVATITGTVNVGVSGSSAPVPTISPFIAVTTIIAAVGIWPEKPY